MWRCIPLRSGTACDMNPGISLQGLEQTASSSIRKLFRLLERIITKWGMWTDHWNTLVNEWHTLRLLKTSFNTAMEKEPLMISLARSLHWSGIVRGWSTALVFLTEISWYQRSGFTHYLRIMQPFLNVTMKIYEVWITEKPWTWAFETEKITHVEVSQHGCFLQIIIRLNRSFPF